MRLFLAVDLDAATRAECVEIEQRLRHDFTRAAISPDLNWVSSEKLHITVRFIGHVDDARGAAIRDSLSSPLESAPFTAVLDRAGVFPASGSPRVVWVGIGDGASQLSRLGEELENRLAPLGLERESRTFSPHLTLARLRKPPRGSENAVIRHIVRDVIARSRWRVERVTLYESRLSPKGATYHPILYLPLAGLRPQQPEG